MRGKEYWANGKVHVSLKSNQTINKSLRNESCEYWRKKSDYFNRLREKWTAKKSTKLIVTNILYIRIYNIYYCFLVNHFLPVLFLEFSYMYINQMHHVIFL